MEAPTGRSGRFIVLDGVDGCGKSTQARRLASALSADAGRTVQHLREPGSTSLGEALRELLLSREQELGPEVESLLFCAARRQMLDQVVGPALDAGEWVVCERFHPSTLAYQGVAGGVPLGPLMDLLLGWAGEPRPDLVIVLDLDPTEASARRGAAGDRIEDRGLSFQVQVAKAMRAYVETADEAVLVSALGSPDEVAQRVLEEVQGALAGA